MTDNAYSTPESDLNEQSIQVEKTFATLGVSRKVCVILMILIDLIYAAAFLVLTILGLNEFGFIFMISSLVLTAITYRAVLERKTINLVWCCIIRLIPLLNLVSCLLVIILVVSTRRENIETA